MVCTECLLIFGTYSIGFVLGSYIFMDCTLFGNYKSKQTFRIHQFILESLRDGYIRDSINRMNNGQANH